MAYMQDRSPPYPRFILGVAFVGAIIWLPFSVPAILMIVCGNLFGGITTFAIITGIYFLWLIVTSYVWLKQTRYYHIDPPPPGSRV